MIEEIKELIKDYVCTEEYSGLVLLDTMKFIENLLNILDKYNDHLIIDKEELK